MSENNVLHHDLEKHLQYFTKIKQQSLDDMLNKSALKQMISNLKNNLETIKENESKTVTLLQNTRTICSQQMETISKLNKYKDAINVLKTELSTKNTELIDLQEKMKNIEWQYDIALQNQTTINLMEIEKIKFENDKKRKDLREELDLVFNSSEIHNKELENKIKILKSNHEEDLKKVNIMNSRMLTNLAVCQKKIFELEEKNKILEQEKKSYFNSKSNVTAINKNNLSDYSYSHQKDAPKSINDVYINEQRNMESDYDFENFNNETENVNCKLQFRKNLQEETHKQIKSSNVGESYGINEKIQKEPKKFVKPNNNLYLNQSKIYIDSDTESDFEKSSYKNTNKYTSQNRKLGQKFENNKPKSDNFQNRSESFTKTNSYKAMSSQLNMMPLNITNTANVPKTQFPNNKKRKLYNPNNYDYLEEY